MVRIFILSFCLFFSSTAFSQSDDFLVYPIRVDHKWGYAKFYGTFVDTLIPPRYDYIGDVYLPWNVAGNQSDLSPFRLFEIDRKVGLLDNFLQESIPNKYNRIRPISKDLFAVEIDQGFQLINKEEEIGLDGIAYDDIKGDRFDDKLQFLFVRKDRKWAVKNKVGDLILDHQFARIQSAGTSGFFKVKHQLNDAYWTLIDTTGKAILTDTYKDIVVINKRVIKVRKEGAYIWEYFLSKKDNNRFIKQPGEYSSIKKITDHMLSLVPYDPILSKEILLKSLKGNFGIIAKMDVKVVGTKDDKKIVPDFYPLDENYAVQSFLPKGKKSIRYKLIDTTGIIHSEFFDTIKVSNKKDIYFVAKDFKIGMGAPLRSWGLFQPVKNKVIPVKAEYTDIVDFEDDIAITQMGNKYGAIAMVNKRKDVLPCIFETVYKSGEKSLQVQTTSEKAVIYQLTKEGKFTEDLIVNNTIVFSENKKRNIKEAVYKQLRTVKGFVKKDKPRWEHLDFKYEEGKLIILNDKEVIQKTNITEKILSIKEFSSDLLVIHLRPRPLKNKVTEIFSKQPIARIIFLSLSKNKVVDYFPLLGFRRFIKDYHYTSFLDISGKMGLIDREGKQLVVNGKPLRFLYIGPFKAGRARVCIGDQLYADKKNKLKQPSRYALETVDEFMDEFNMKKGGKATIRKTNEAPLYALSQEGNSRWGYIDEQGKLIIDANFDYAEDFNIENDRALVFKTLPGESALRQNISFDLINKNGNKLLDVSDDLLNISYKKISAKNSFFQITVGKTPTFYFNKKGHQLFVNPTRMRPFSEGLALFRSTDNKWGFVDTIGNVLIEPRFKYARPFSDGMALVVDETGFCSFINPKGEIVFKTQFTAKQQIGLGDFHEGRSWFKGPKGWFWGCYDNTGKVIIEPQFYHKIVAGALPKVAEPYVLPMDFRNGVASIRVLDKNGKPAYTIIDTQGKKIVAEGKYGMIESFNDHGLAVYSLPSKKEKGILNKEGQQLSPPRYQRIKPFVNGFAMVQSEKNKWGLIDIVGKEILRPAYQEIGLASEGRVPVKSNSTDWHFVNMSGKKIISGPFKSVTPFQNGISFVNQKEKDMLIDKSGNPISVSVGKPLFFSEGVLGVLRNENAPKRKRQYFYSDDSGNNILGRNFKEITPFQLGVAKVRILAEEVPGPGVKKKKELLGAINKRGVMIVPPKFRNLHLQPDGNIVINPQRFYGLVSLSGKILLDPIYDLISYYPKDKLFRVEQGEKVGYFELEKDKVEWIWEMQY